MLGIALAVAEQQMTNCLCCRPHLLGFDIEAEEAHETTGDIGRIMDLYVLIMNKLTNVLDLG